MNTGEVLAGAVGEAYTVIGDTVNVAARLQSAARPGSVTVGERTMRATDAARSSYRELEPLALKGKAEPVPAWEAVGLIAEQPARRAAAAREAPLVGPRAGAPTLDGALRARGARGCSAPRDGRRRGRRGQVAPAARARGALCRRDTPTVRTGRCLPYGSGIVFWALGEVLREECGIVDIDSAEEAWGKLRAIRGSSCSGRQSARRPSARRR